MRRIFQTVCLAAIALCLVGCLEATQVFTVNPDGSGKATVDMIVAMSPHMGAQQGDPKQNAKDATEGFISGAKGVDAWSDVSYEAMADGRIHIKATAYFPDVHAVELNPSLKVSWKKDDGGMTLTVDPKNGQTPEPAAPVKLSDEEVAAKVTEARDQYKQGRPMAEMMLKTMRLDTSYNLPGTVSAVDGFKKTDKGAQLVIEGKKMLEAMDKFNADDKAMAEHIRSGKSENNTPDAVMKDVLGTTANPTAKVTGELKPLFDYKAESQAAKAKQDAMFEKAGLKKPGDAPATEPAETQPAVQ